MQVEVREALGDDRQIVRNMFLFYFHDLAQWADSLAVNAYGLPVETRAEGTTPRTLEEAVTYNWWIRDECKLFVIRADGNPAGFAVVNAQTKNLPADVDVDMLDFFIASKYRRQGIGRVAARFLFDEFRGRWLVEQLAGNAAAIAFWNHVVGEYTNGDYEKLDNGAAQRFDNRNSTEIAPTVMYHLLYRSSADLFIRQRREALGEGCCAKVSSRCTLDK